jgi:hypothetical protein
MGINYSTVLGNQGLNLLRIISQGLCIDTVWNAGEKVIKSLSVSYHEPMQALNVFLFEVSHQIMLIATHTGIKLVHTYLSWVIVPFIVAGLKKYFVQSMAKRAKCDIEFDDNARMSYELGIASTRYWGAWFKSFIMPSAWTPAFYLGIEQGRYLGYRRKYDFSFSALCF